ncbi:Amidase [Cupriavidus taiwanensis]|uniref:Amidase n=1 Tax=Cupriavidus taiwanensis TaxID=164546 RepID=A0A976B385_9BURK|nr:amidase [Cupriavidus taiwanensis]SOZ69603.1 Amidase [Cupriavidus taiwanensis]SOZ70338.1 Amidase [Cupriavidus taiwanensis]SOZ73242.1 Amidase [Cupriavidus taiwanensis]SPA10109.1 Amidase [Cupriavidus taiwanensis]
MIAATMPNPADLSATALLALYARRELSPVEALDAVLDRIHRYDLPFNAFRFVDVDGSRAAARASERRWMRGAPFGLLDGVAVSFKDLLHVRGWPTRMGSLATSDAPQPDDCPAAARLREHGAVLLGKTNTSEFGTKGITESALAGITRNPWNRLHTPGGSSGGAAAATALGLGPLHVATDGGGSIRAPAAACGVFGLKPSSGRVPCYPTAHSGTLFHVGPIARSVTDAALLLTVISGPDIRDEHALPYQPRDWRSGLDDGIAGLRVAYSRTLGYLPVDPEIGHCCDAAVQRLATLGAIVEEADPGFENPAAVFRVLWDTGVARLLRGFSTDRLALLDPLLPEAAARGRDLSAVAYLDAVARRGQLGVAMRRFHERYDLLVTPTLASGPPVVNVPHSAPHCLPFNLTGQPAASVPCGVTQAGLPIGLQIVGPNHADARVLLAARALEATFPWPTPSLDPQGDNHDRN